VPVQFNLKAVVDLREPETQKLLDTDADELRINFRASGPRAAPTQILGERCAVWGGIDGFLYESAALAGNADLAVFESALRALGSSLRVFDPINKLHDKLP
jgi:hypothetical protein